MAKDRARDESRKLPDMGKALGWDRTLIEGVAFAHRTANKDKAEQGHYSEGSFVPGAGHIDDEFPHRGWLGIGGSQSGRGNQTE